ncbi:MAG: V-type ATP synthase subunit D [Candidatus Omnitrophica bacterium]|nr:V-type ATP synthase subunit D [Candidatus Omnitrophota bacterium]
MEKVKLTKNELKKQKDSLKRFTRYLPTLILKKQQLQAEAAKIQQQIEEISSQRQKAKEDVMSWVKVFAEEVGIESLVKVKSIEVLEGNIAGIDIPVFKELVFEDIEYDLFTTPLWVDDGIEAIKKQAELDVKYKILQKQLTLIQRELQVTTQRVNLFEKIKIPQSKEHIRRIKIFLGDMQTAAVVTGKIAKDKIAKKQIEALSI